MGSFSAAAYASANMDFTLSRITGLPEMQPQVISRKLPICAAMRDAESLVSSGVVLSVIPQHCKSLLSTGEYKILDVRPMWERERAFVGGSYHVPLFIEDEDLSFITLVKKWIHLGYIGMWMGHKLTVQNEQFLEQVQESVSHKQEKLLVACGEGLRSMVAIDLLHTDGHSHLAWICGGFNNARDGDFEDVQGRTKLQFATIGGVSEIFLKVILLAQGFANALKSKVNKSS